MVEVPQKMDYFNLFGIGNSIEARPDPFILPRMAALKREIEKEYLHTYNGLL